MYCYSCSNPDQLNFDWKSLQADHCLVLKKKWVGDVNPISSSWLSTAENSELKISSSTAASLKTYIVDTFYDFAFWDRFVAFLFPPGKRAGRNPWNILGCSESKC